jgi:Carboxypeptidase regulatory-like domain
MKHLFFFLIFLLASIVGHTQVTLLGTVTDEKGEPCVGAVVMLLKNGVQKTGRQTDIDGNYRLSDLDPGRYDIECSLIGYRKNILSGVICAGKVVCNFKLYEDAKLLPVCVITEYRIPFVTVCYRVHSDVEYAPQAQYTRYKEEPTIELKVLGNPFTDYFALDIKSETVEKATIVLRNIEGKVVKTEATHLSKGDNRIEITSLSGLISGTYTVSVHLNDENSRVYLVKKQVISKKKIYSQIVVKM